MGWIDALIREVRIMRTLTAALASLYGRGARPEKITAPT